jgi:O-antigen/teichoic acid export membrane protein
MQTEATPGSTGLGPSRRIAANFLSVAATNAIGLVLTLAVGIYIRRTLGPEAIGQLGWTLAVLSYVAILANPGLTTVGQRELARNAERGQSLFCLLLTLQTILSLGAYAVVVVVALLHSRAPSVSLLLAIQGATLLISAWNVGWILQAHERLAATSVATLLINALQIPFLLLLIHNPSDLVLYAFLALPIALLGAIFNLLYAGRHSFIKLFRFRPTIVGASTILRSAWPLALSQGAVLIYFNCDTVILGFTDGDIAVGQYTTAYKLMLVSTVITSAMWSAYFPGLARSHNVAGCATALSTEYLRTLCWMGFPIAALGWALGRHAVILMYGPDYALSGVYFEWLCINVGLMFANYGIVSTLVPWGHEKLQFKITVTAAIVNLTLNLIMIPIYGPYAAIATTLVAEGVVLLLGIVARRRLRIFWHPIFPIMMRPFCCATIVGLAIAALPQELEHFWWAELLGGILCIATGAVILERLLLAPSILQFKQRILGRGPLR